MEHFVAREQELATLQAEYERKGSSLVVLYGRRRVGKTTLISEFIKDKQALFFLASEESEVLNRHAFLSKVADYISSDLLRLATVSDWDTIFRAMMDHSFETKPVIVMDEFQYIGKSNPAFPLVLQRIWDEQLKGREVMLILCGSLIPMMQSQTLEYGSPLYGRTTAQIRLKQIPFRYNHEFFPTKTPRELVEMYSITGGVPNYIEQFSEQKDIYKAIWACVLNRSSYLYDEPHFLLQQEVSEVGSYFSIIRTIAAGNHKLSAIASALELKATGLTKYLKTLIDLDVLEREVPVTEENPERSKKGLYKIKDNYIRFWFAFIYPNMSFLESGNKEIVMEKLRKSLISHHTAFVYEDVCREKMWEMNGQNAWPFHFSRLGRWWDANTEIGICALDPEGKNFVVGECKFWTEPVGINVLRDLEEKAAKVPWEKEERTVWYVLFSTGGFTEELRHLAEEREDLMLTE